MQNVLLKHGTLATIDSNKDIIEVITEFCGEDLADLVSIKLEYVDREEIYAKERVHSESESYLANLEEKVEFIREVMEQLEELSKYLENTKRINRDTIYQKINSVITMINKEL